jgi:peptidyl-prolyl cis-trans isomerase D
MAVLEKLRKRPKLLMGLIGGALVLFILTAIDNPMSLFRGNDTLALQVGDKNIDIRQFSEEQEKLQKKNPDQKIDGPTMQQQVVQQIIGQTLITEECDDASINVSDDEILNVLFKETGLDKKTFDQIKNANPNPNSQDPQQQQLAEAKVYCQNRVPEIATELKSTKLGLAIMGCIKPNKLEEQLLKEEQTPYDIEYTKVDYAQYTNKYKVSDEEIKEAYDLYKECFKIDQEKRRISYIKVDLDPSANDTKVANGMIAKIYNSFASQEGVLGIKNNKDTHLFIDSLMTNSNSNKLTVVTTGASEPKDPIFTELLEGGINSMKMRNPKGPRDRNTYIYKVTKMVQCPDSLGLNTVQVVGTKQMQDSIFALLTNGVTIDSLNRSNKNQNIAIQMFDPSKAPSVDALLYQDSIREKIIAHLDGSVFLLDSQTQGDQNIAVFAQVAQHKAPITLYSVARAKYENEPSETTVNNLKKALQAYIDKNKTTADFKKNAKAAKYDVQECVVDASNAAIGSQMTGTITGTRDLIKWAFDNKPGTVSEIKEDDEHGYLVVAAVEDAYIDYIPYTDPTVKQQLTTYILNKKIGEGLLKDCNSIKATDVNAYAQKFNSTVDSVTYIPGAPNIISDLKVAGRIVGMGKNAIGKIQVVAGDNALYVVKVNKQGTPRPLPKQEIAGLYQRKMNADAYGMLYNSRKIANLTLKFSN